MNFEDLTPEQQAKAKACKTPEDVLALAKEDGIELTEEQLEAVSGGWNDCDDHTCEQYKRFCRNFR